MEGRALPTPGVGDGVGTLVGFFVGLAVGLLVILHVCPTCAFAALHPPTHSYPKAHVHFHGIALPMSFTHIPPAL